jgi:hypothetical protein
LTLATGNSQVLFAGGGFSNFSENEIASTMRATQYKGTDTDLVLAQTYGEMSYHEYQHSEIASTIKATGGVTGMGGEVLVVEQSNTN